MFFSRSLPVELFENVASYLTPKEHAASRLVSRRWNVFIVVAPSFVYTLCLDPGDHLGPAAFNQRLEKFYVDARNFAVRGVKTCVVIFSASADLDPYRYGRGTSEEWCSDFGESWILPVLAFVAAHNDHLVELRLWVNNEGRDILLDSPCLRSPMPRLKLLTLDIDTRDERLDTYRLLGSELLAVSARTVTNLTLVNIALCTPDFELLPVALPVVRKLFVEDCHSPSLSLLAIPRLFPNLVYLRFAEFCDYPVAPEQWDGSHWLSSPFRSAALKRVEISLAYRDSTVILDNAFARVQIRDIGLDLTRCRHPIIDNTVASIVRDTGITLRLLDLEPAWGWHYRVFVVLTSASGFGRWICLRDSGVAAIKTLFPIAAHLVLLDVSGGVHGYCWDWKVDLPRLKKLSIRISRALPFRHGGVWHTVNRLRVWAYNAPRADLWWEEGRLVVAEEIDQVVPSVAAATLPSGPSLRCPGLDCVTFLPESFDHLLSFSTSRYIVPSRDVAGLAYDLGYWRPGQESDAHRSTLPRLVLQNVQWAEETAVLHPAVTTLFRSVSFLVGDEERATVEGIDDYAKMYDYYRV